MIDLTEFESRAVPLRALGVVVSQNGTQLARKLWDSVDLLPGGSGLTVRLGTSLVQPGAGRGAA